MTDKLARVRWEMGQSLLPEHFIIQEESLIRDSVLRFRTRGLPDYGIASLKLNDTLLAEGVFSIQSLTLLMPSGTLLAIPGNCIVSPFNLNISGAIHVSVYLHLLRKSPAECNERQDDEVVARVIHTLVMSGEQGYPEAIESLKLAEAEKDPEGNWQLSGNYIPPLLEVGTSPFLENELSELRGHLDQFMYRLNQEIAASYMSGESLSSAKQCLKSIYRIRRFLANLFAKINFHPYYVYEALKEFYTEVCFYQNMIPEFVTEPFDPDDLAISFARIFEPLKERMRIVQAPPPYLPFELRDNVWKIALPVKSREAKEVYFLIQKGHVSQTLLTKDMKLSSLSRLSAVHKLALQGVPLQKIGRPPFQHSFGPEVDFYRITEGEEWDHALRDQSLGFYNNPSFEGVKFYLFWRFA